MSFQSFLLKLTLVYFQNPVMCFFNEQKSACGMLSDPQKSLEWGREGSQDPEREAEASQRRSAQGGSRSKGRECTGRRCTKRRCMWHPDAMALAHGSFLAWLSCPVGEAKRTGGAVFLPTTTTATNTSTSTPCEARGWTKYSFSHPPTAPTPARRDPRC